MFHSDLRERARREGERELIVPVVARLLVQAEPRPEPGVGRVGGAGVGRVGHPGHVEEVASQQVQLVTGFKIVVLGNSSKMLSIRFAQDGIIITSYVSHGWRVFMHATDDWLL